VANTMPRSLRIPPDLWEAAVEKAKAEGTTLTAVVIAALTRYVRREVK
jgi:predicted HicB family RNase H-like nuclease